MTSNKFGSLAKRLISQTAAGEGDEEASFLVRTTGAAARETEVAIERIGGRVRTRAGDVLSISIPVRAVTALSELDEVLYIEAAEPLYPEAPSKDPGEP